MANGKQWQEPSGDHPAGHYTYRPPQSPYEQFMEIEYLERLGEAYARFFYDYEGSPLLIVNAAAIDPIHRESDYEELLRTIVRVKRGRHFFNPAAAELA